MANNILADISREFLSGSSQAVDIITFSEASWGLGINLLPTQRFLLKTMYGMKLDSVNKTIKVPDIVNDRILFNFTEQEFLSWLYEEGRCNVNSVEGEKFQEIILSIGRRGTKCRCETDLISTTVGSITFSELHRRLSIGESVGITTYDPKTFRRSTSYDIKSKMNGLVECFLVETKRGIRETSSWNHPYLIWRDNWEKPAFVDVRDILVGDKIAVASCTELFGRGGIGVKRANMLGRKNGIKRLRKVPDEILHGNREEVSSFVYGFFRYGDVVNPYCGSLSMKMADGIRHILQKFGIHCVVSELHGEWSVRLACESDAVRFESEIGTISEHCVYSSELDVSSDVMWDVVSNIRAVGFMETVDIEVVGTHIIGGDLISHNTTLSSIISNYEFYKLLKHNDPSDYYGFPSSSPIVILNVAPTDDQASDAFSRTQTMALRCPFMKDRSLHQTMTYFDLQTDVDMKEKGVRKRASLTSLCGGCSSNSLRGHNAILIVMDEMAHFIDNNGRFSGEEVYKALKPSMSGFGRDGKIVCISSPYAKYGQFYKRFIESFDDAKTAKRLGEPQLVLAFKMYTAMANPGVDSSILKAERRRDRIGFMCEYGGEFSDSVMAWIDDEEEFKKCVVNIPFKSKGEKDIPYFYGVDLGFKNDGTAITIVHKDKDSNKIILDHFDVWFSGSSDVWDCNDNIYDSCGKYKHQDLLKMSDVVSEILELALWFPPKYGLFDQHNGYALSELMLSRGLGQFEMQNFSESLNSEIYQLVKRMYSEQLLLIPHHDVFIREFLSLEAESRSKDKTVVRAPHRVGAHDDIADSFCRAVWGCYNHFKGKLSNVASGVLGSRPMPLQRTQAGFIRDRLVNHGAHPRDAYRLGGRMKGMMR